MIATVKTMVVEQSRPRERESSASEAPASGRRFFVNAATSAKNIRSRPKARLDSAARMSAPTHNGNGFTGAPLAPPQNLEAEQSVLGAVLLSDTTLPALIIDERLTPDDFYRESHGRIYQGMLDLNTQGERVDVLDADRAPQAGAVSWSRSAARPRSSCSRARCPAIGNVRQYARIVRENAMLRRLLHASYEIQAQVHGHEALPRELVDRAERLILEVAHEDSRKDFRSIEQVLRLRARQAPEAERSRARRSPARRPASRTWTRSPAASSPAT